jgi:hypothetical protein
MDLVYEGKIKYKTYGRIDVPIRVYKKRDSSKGEKFQGMIVVKKEEREEERPEGGETKSIDDAIYFIRYGLNSNDLGEVEEIWRKNP